MSHAPSVALAGTTEDHHGEGAANVTLRGTARGLEILIAGTPTAAALGARLTELLAEAPGFFAGSNARVAIDGMLPIGALACLEQIAERFELRLVEIGPAAARRLRGEMPPIPPVPTGLAELPRTRLADSAESSAGEANQIPASDAAAKAASVPGAPDDAAAKAASVPGGTGDPAAKAASCPASPITAGRAGWRLRTSWTFWCFNLCRTSSPSSSMSSLRLTRANCGSVVRAKSRICSTILFN